MSPLLGENPPLARPAYAVPMPVSEGQYTNYGPQFDTRDSPRSIQSGSASESESITHSMEPLIALLTTRSNRLDPPLSGSTRPAPYPSAMPAARPSQTAWQDPQANAYTVSGAGGRALASELQAKLALSQPKASYAAGTTSTGRTSLDGQRGSSSNSLTSLASAPATSLHDPYYDANVSPPPDRRWHALEPQDLEGLAHEQHNVAYNLTITGSSGEAMASQLQHRLQRPHTAGPERPLLDRDPAPQGHTAKVNAWYRKIETIEERMENLELQYRGLEQRTSGEGAREALPQPPQQGGNPQVSWKEDSKLAAIASDGEDPKGKPAKVQTRRPDADASDDYDDDSEAPSPSPTTAQRWQTARGLMQQKALKMMQKLARNKSDEVECIDCDNGIEKLKTGNKMFVDSASDINYITRILKQCSADRRKNLAGGQAPFVTIISCSDSRVPPELIFNGGLGEIFVVRNAGNTWDEAALASVQYGIVHLGTPVLCILGHQKCGAVAAAMSMFEQSLKKEAGEASPTGNKYLGTLMEKLQPAVKTAVDCVCGRSHAGAEPPAMDWADESLKAAIQQAAVEANVRNTAEHILRELPDVAAKVDAGEVALMTAYYDLTTGEVQPVPISGEWDD